MANWNNPTTASLYTNVLSELKDRDVSAIKMQEGTTETNLPSGAKRYNVSTNKFETWNGSTWSNLPFHTTIDNHIADASLHFAPPAGSIFMWPTNSAPTGFLLCDGTAVSRTTYATLFALIGTTFGVGDGSTTFNLPNFKQRMPIGRDAGQAACDTIGETGGSFNHTHTTPTHQHTIAGHTHDMGNHVHGQPGHTHTAAAHNHSVPGHFHDCQGSGADIFVADSGSHTHNYGAKEGGSNGSGANRPQGASSSSGSNVTYSTNSDTHSHSHSAVQGRVGNVSAGYSGDSFFATTTDGALATSSSGSDNTFGPSTNTTGSSGTLTTTAGEGGSTSGSNNQAYLTVNFIMKT